MLALVTQVLDIRDPDVSKLEKLDAGLENYWGKEDAVMEDGAAK